MDLKQKENFQTHCYMLHKILFEHLGEYSYTGKQPVAVWAEGMVDLDEKTTHTIFSSDDWRPCPVTRYEIREVELPDWLSPERYLAHCSYVQWENIWVTPDVKSWSQSWQEFLFRADEFKRGAVVTLLKVKSFRSEFRKSLRAQLEAWLDTPEEDRKYASPFSQRQWQCLLKYVR